MNLQNSARPTLVVLAAGAGSRYGGLKQLDAVGPGAATLIDYTAFDARRAGFERIVLVIRSETEREFRAHFEPRLRPRLELAFCFQRPVASPTGSAKREYRLTDPFGDVQIDALELDAGETKTFTLQPFEGRVFDATAS